MTGHDDGTGPPQATGRAAPDAAATEAAGAALLDACLAEMRRAEARLPADHAAGAKRRILALALAEQARIAPGHAAASAPDGGGMGRIRPRGWAAVLAGGLLAAGLLIGLTGPEPADPPAAAAPGELASAMLELVEDESALSDAALAEGALLAGGLAEAILFDETG